MLSLALVALFCLKAAAIECPEMLNEYQCSGINVDNDTIQKCRESIGNLYCVATMTYKISEDNTYGYLTRNDSADVIPSTIEHGQISGFVDPVASMYRAACPDPNCDMEMTNIHIYAACNLYDPCTSTDSITAPAPLKGDALKPIPIYCMLEARRVDKDGSSTWKIDRMRIDLLNTSLTAGRNGGTFCSSATEDLLRVLCTNGNCMRYGSHAMEMICGLRSPGSFVKYWMPLFMAMLMMAALIFAIPTLILFYRVHFMAAVEIFKTNVMITRTYGAKIEQMEVVNTETRNKRTKGEINHEELISKQLKKHMKKLAEEKEEEEQQRLDQYSSG